MGPTVAIRKLGFSFALGLCVFAGGCFGADPVNGSDETAVLGDIHSPGSRCAANLSVQSRQSLLIHAHFTDALAEAIGRAIATSASIGELDAQWWLDSPLPNGDLAALAEALRQGGNLAPSLAALAESAPSNHGAWLLRFLEGRP